MNGKYDNNFFEFDDENQRIIVVEGQNEDDLPKALNEFVSKDKDGQKKFDTTKYFNTFVEEVYNVIAKGNVTTPKGLTSFSTEFTPCEVCTSHEETVPQYVRCHHEESCEDHKKKTFEFKTQGIL